MRIRIIETWSWLVVLAGVLATSVSTQPLAAQDELPGVSLGLVYANTYLPALAVQPFIGGFGGDMIASQVEAIVGRDLRNSDQFEVIDSLPDAMVGSYPGNDCGNCRIVF